MAMAKIDDAGDLPRSELIRDIGKQSVCCASAPTCEQQLMQRSKDPLLVREFVLIQTCSAPAPAPRQSLNGDTAIALAGRSLSGTVADQPRPTISSSRFGDPEPRRECSACPMPFEPSDRDRDSAIEFQQRQWGAAAQSTASLGRGAMAACLAGATALLLVLLSLISG
jgi:hypothetical protein